MVPYANQEKRVTRSNVVDMCMQHIGWCLSVLYFNFKTYTMIISDSLISGDMAQQF